MKSKKKGFIPHDYGLTNIKNAVNRYKGTCLLEQDRKELLYWQARFISLVPVLYRT